MLLNMKSLRAIHRNRFRCIVITTTVTTVTTAIHRFIATLKVFDVALDLLIVGPQSERENKVKALFGRRAAETREQTQRHHVTVPSNDE